MSEIQTFCCYKKIHSTNKKSKGTMSLEFNFWSKKSTKERINFTIQAYNCKSMKRDFFPSSWPSRNCLFEWQTYFCFNVMDQPRFDPFFCHLFIQFSRQKARVQLQRRIEIKPDQTFRQAFSSSFSPVFFQAITVWTVVVYYKVSKKS